MHSNAADPTLRKVGYVAIEGADGLFCNLGLGKTSTETRKGPMVYKRDLNNPRKRGRGLGTRISQGSSGALGFTPKFNFRFVS